ncbi:MAG: hypothetical protein NC347_08505 [Clostridium sp.]|nr:hypothetical protein [Clostridium sp.]
MGWSDIIRKQVQGRCSWLYKLIYVVLTIIILGADYKMERGRLARQT